ncbi:hypothetical protein QP185_21205 [Sphingomonas aerolata]|uniref:hypothetical protein n=1 Tax=Sphingomonas aerolata TaxID=185951 RepID=UPI002FE1595C
MHFDAACGRIDPALVDVAEVGQLGAADEDAAAIDHPGFGIGHLPANHCAAGDPDGGSAQHREQVRPFEQRSPGFFQPNAHDPGIRVTGNDRVA